MRLTFQSCWFPLLNGLHISECNITQDLEKIMQNVFYPGLLHAAGLLLILLHREKLVPKIVDKC